LAVRPGTTSFDTIRVVYSHPQAFGQCKRFLEASLPNATFEAALSTTEAVQLTLRRDGDAAAISTARAAQLYGADVLARSIQDSPNNVTRFVVLGPGLRPST